MNPPTAHWRLETDADRIAWLTFDLQGSTTNTLGAAAIRELAGHIATVAAARPRALVIRSGKDSGFIAGADVSEFIGLADPETARQLVRSAQQVLDRLAALPLPTVAAIHGFALGGGLELALACAYRVAADERGLNLGLPEVLLGIHSGFGGTVRLPQLIGAGRALDLMLTGRAVRGPEALRAGLLDRLVPRAELETAARAIALSAPRLRRAPFAQRLLGWPLLRHLVAARARRQVARRVRRDHYPAPWAIIDLWARHGARGAAAQEAEARSIASLLCSDTSRSLVRVFFLQNRLKSLGASGRRLAHVHVVGAGVMGGDIAAWCAARGLTVTLQDRELRFVEPALARARALFARRHDPAAAERLQADVEGHGAAHADLVIEAIFEDADAKRALYARLEPRLRPDALLATNTSSIRLEDLARDLADPTRLVGLHFFNPVAKMQLIEVIRTAATRDDIVTAALAFARQLDRLPLPCRSSPGFVVNRILMPYLNEAMLAVDEGIPPAVIDQVATDFGMPMGPLELADTVGLDIAVHVGRILGLAWPRPAPQGTARLVEAGRLGRKSGHGYYEWRDGRPLRPATRITAPADLCDRLVLQYLNEAVACLRDGVVTDADLIDAAMVFGTGFAPFRGGPLHYARNRGAGAIVARLEQLAASHGARFQPDPGWRALATPGG